MMVALVIGVVLLCSGISTAQTAPPPAPPNDNFADSQLISSGAGWVSGTTKGGTREDPSEPDHYTSNPNDADWWLGEHTVWYSWKAPDSGSTTIDTCQANIDSILAVYTGAELNSLTRVADNNNDYCGGGWGSKVTFNASAGTNYRIVVGDAGGLQQSTFTLKVSSPASTTYTIKDLGTLPGGSFSSARDINNVGQVVGYANAPGQEGMHAFLYSEGQMQDLGTLPGGTYSFAHAINDSGQVVGEATTERDYRAFLYSDGQMQDLGTLGGSHSWARGINDSGQVVGRTNFSSGSGHAFLYSGGQMQDLGTLPGDNTSGANDVNASGQVVGYSDFGSEDTPRAFLYSDGQMQDLGTIRGSETVANAINDSGQIVGWTHFVAFVYSDGQMQDLNELIPPDSGWWRLTYATAINSAGQIVGEGEKRIIRDGEVRSQTRAFLATPTQAPRVTSTVPTANARAVDPASNVSATFSEEMDASSINPTTFKLSFRRGSNTKEVAASVHYDAATHTATLDPTKSLQKGVSYNAVVSTGAKDLEGNTLEQEHSWSFTVSK